jgi:bilirubin oxidase
MVHLLCFSAVAQIVPEGNMDPTIIPKYVDQLPIPQAMSRTSKINQKGMKSIDYYEIGVRQIDQQILPLSDEQGNPANYPSTTLWTYGSVNHPATFQYPAPSIEAKFMSPVRVKWFNEPKDPVTGKFLPHLFPVDQTLHWANPPKDCIDGMGTSDCRGQSPLPYTGPVPIVPHLHGAHVGPDSDGYPESWWLPAAANIPAGYATTGTRFDQFDKTNTTPGSAVYQYPNDQRATALWYHDHSLGLTRLNVYAGPVGFYLLRGGSSDTMPGVLPGPGPAQGDPPGMQYYEIPIAIQDKTFSIDGSRFVYPDNRAYFEALLASQLQIPFIPSPATGGISDVSPLWNPEFFANTMVVNGKTWPTTTVEPRRYRFRFLNGCDSRFLILKLYSGAPPETLIDPVTGAGLPVTPTHSFWQIGSDGGFLPAPVQLNELLMGPAERVDAIVDFTGLPVGGVIYVVNDSPDEPFGWGVPGTDFPVADRAGTGQVMKFVVRPLNSVDTSVDPASGLLALPARTPLGAPTNTRQVSLNENESKTVYVPVDAAGNYILDASNNLVNCDPNTFVPGAEGDACVPLGPTSAMLGTVTFKPDGAGGIMPMGMGMMWMDGITENPALNSTEVWEIYNFTMDAHPRPEWSRPLKPIPNTCRCLKASFQDFLRPEPMMPSTLQSPGPSQGMRGLRMCVSSPRSSIPSGGLAWRRESIRWL